MAKIKSNLVDDMTYCIECGSTYAECHHVFFGSYQKKWCTKHELHLPLCFNCHKGNTGPHMNRTKDIEYKQMAQRYYEENIDSREQFMSEFGKNYL